MSNILKLIISIVICQLAGIIGAFFTTDSIPTWYNSLNKPEFNPPNWLFGPVWTILYLLMGISLFIIWKEDLKNKNVKNAFAIFIVQLIVNLLWSIVFFGMHSISGGLIVIIVLLVIIIITIVKFKKISFTASILLIPYLLWVCFATILNFYFYKLN